MSINAALQSEGAVATATDSINSSFLPTGTNDGDRSRVNWGSNGGWNDNGSGGTKYLTITFAARKTINKVIFVTYPDDAAAWNADLSDTSTLTCASFGVKDYDVEYLDGTWQSLGVNKTNNTLVINVHNFSDVSCDAIRIKCTASNSGDYYRVLEVEAWTAASAAFTARPYYDMRRIVQ